MCQSHNIRLVLCVCVWFTPVPMHRVVVIIIIIIHRRYSFRQATMRRRISRRRVGTCWTSSSGTWEWNLISLKCKRKSSFRTTSSTDGLDDDGDANCSGNVIRDYLFTVSTVWLITLRFCLPVYVCVCWGVTRECVCVRVREREIVCIAAAAALVHPLFWSLHNINR